MSTKTACTNLITMFLIIVATSCTSIEDNAIWRPVTLMDAKQLQSPLKIPTELVAFETTEGTNMNLDVSPDGNWVAFDMLGDIFRVPISGGDAIPVTSGMAFDQSPRFAPDGKSIYFISDRVGHKNVWKVSLSDNSVLQVTTSDRDIQAALNWTQNKTSLLAGRAYPNTNEMTLHTINPNTGEITTVEHLDGPWIDMNTFELLRNWSTKTFSGSMTTDGQVYLSGGAFDVKENRMMVIFDRLDIRTQMRTAMTPMDAPYTEFKPQLSNDGNLLAYFRQYRDRRTELRVLDRTSGDSKMTMTLNDADDATYFASHDLRPNYAFTPDDKDIVLWQAGKIYRVSLADGSVSGIPFRAQVEQEVVQRITPSLRKFGETGDAQIIRWPSISADAESVVFAAIGFIWLMDSNTGVVRRLTDGADFEYMPALSPDGRSVAYVSFQDLKNGYGPARLMVARVDDVTKPQMLLTAENSVYLLPRWSMDGAKIAVIRETTALEVGVEGGAIIGKVVFGWTGTENGSFNQVAAAPEAGGFAMRSGYSRYVGFDQTGLRLVFSYPISSEDTELSVANLDGGDPHVLAVGRSIQQITPAPGLNHLALTGTDRTVWTIPFRPANGAVELSSASSEARLVGDGYYVNWSDANHLSHGLARNFYRYDINENRRSVHSILVPFETPGAKMPIAFTGARLITLSGNTGAGRVIESGTVLISGQRILAVGADGEVPIPVGAQIVQAAGKTIIPGLIDTHYHRIGGSGNSGYRLPNDRFEDPTAILYGVTSAWEPGGVVSDGTPATADLQAAGRILGPRWSHAAMGQLGLPFDQLSNYGAALAAVRRHKALGVETLKEYNTPTRKQRQWLSAAARAEGLGIISHIESFDDTMSLVIDGYTGGDHVYVPTPFYKDVKELLVQTGYIWTPNITISQGILGEVSDKDKYFWRDVLSKRPDEMIKYIAISGREEHDVSKPSLPYEKHRVGRLAKTAADLAKSGGRVGVSAHNMPGILLHKEMWYLNMGGLSAADVLRATIAVNAEKIGWQEEVGSLEVGKMADLLILEDNPLEDITNTLSVRYTVQGGVIYDSHTAERVAPESLAVMIH